MFEYVLYLAVIDVAVHVMQVIVCLQWQIQHSTCHGRISVRPQVITYSAPISIVLDLHSTLTAGGATGKTDLDGRNVIWKKLGIMRSVNIFMIFQIKSSSDKDHIELILRKESILILNN